MINVFKKFPDIALQNPASSRIIPADFMEKGVKAMERAMCTLVNPAREGIGNKYPFKELKVLDNKKYEALSEPLNEIGKMLGGWIRNVDKEIPLFPRKGGE